MKKTTTMLSIIAILTLTACGGSAVTYADGTYTAESAMYENDDGTDIGNGYGSVTITIKDGAITDCSFVTYEPDGTLKDEDYGKANGEIFNQAFYNKSQLAVEACDTYAHTLAKTGDLNAVDAVSGATVNYDLFVDAVTEALKEASK